MSGRRVFVNKWPRRIHRINTHNMHVITGVSFRAYCKRLAAAQFDAVIKPNFRNAIGKDGEIVVCHLHLLMGKAQVLEQDQKANGR